MQGDSLQGAESADGCSATYIESTLRDLLPEVLKALLNT